jgi:hypothetical protein
MEDIAVDLLHAVSARHDRGIALLLCWWSVNM